MIRPLTGADVVAAAAVIERARSWALGEDAAGDRIPTASDYAAVLASADRAWISEVGGQIVAVVSIELGPPAQVTAIAVDPPAQGAGVGSALHERLSEEVSAHDLALTIPPGGEQLRDFLLGRGWKADGQTLRLGADRC